MDENTSVSLNALGIETMQADAVSAEEVNPAQEIMVESPAPADTAEQAPIEQTFTRAEVDEMIRRKSEFFKRGLENDPTYQFAKELYGQYAAQGKNPAEALAQARQEQFDRRAAELAQNPEEMAKFMLSRNMPQQPVQETVEQRAGKIATEIRGLEAQGRLPADFNLDAYVQAYPDFLADCEQYGVGAAVKMAGMAMPARLPQSTRPQNTAQPQTIDVTKMNSKQFADFEAKIDAAMREGRRVTL